MLQNMRHACRICGNGFETHAEGVFSVLICKMNMFCTAGSMLQLIENRTNISELNNLLHEIAADMIPRLQISGIRR